MVVMKVEILFMSSSTPKTIEASAVYTKGNMLCVEWIPDAEGKTLIIKYPLCNIFHVAHFHGDHLGTCKHS